MHHIHERYCARRQCCRQKLSSIKLVYFCSYSLSKMGDYVQYILTGFMSSEIQSFNCSLALSRFFFYILNMYSSSFTAAFPKKHFGLRQYQNLVLILLLALSQKVLLIVIETILSSHFTIITFAAAAAFSYFQTITLSIP